MKNVQPRTIHLKDYQQPDYWICKTALTVDIHDDVTRVKAVLDIRLNSNKFHETLPELVLHGQQMALESVVINDQKIASSDYLKTDSSLTLYPSEKQFTTEIVTLLKPRENTSLEGLYQSGGMYCTQCEAEGFRKITYYLDRPDVMSTFITKVIADKQKYPVLLSNGNAVESGELDENRHFVVWEDPFPKPSYLFALVAGNLECIEDTFTTMSGREVTLRIFTEAHNISKCDYAMLSLKRSMKWDEKVYGREYDLDIFMVVAVDAFNMGAMENKGLNIFNSACVLARPDTATDAAFQRIESIVGHEYFHNWSGNRVTCRDWFQLSLKEGFTVFRDQEFSADMNSRAVKRIEDVNLLRNSQFIEDAGPMAHPVRPDSFIEISNFYTSTVYNKGAEVVRMIHNILGAENFRKGSDLYFERHDGQAVTCDDFSKAMEDASGIDLTQFKRWYFQSGTPVLDITDQYDESSQQYTLIVKQSCPPTPGQPQKQPFHIPLATGLLSRKGQELSLNEKGDKEVVLHIKKPEERFVFEGIITHPLPSLLRGFSAPVTVNYHYSREDLVTLMSHDTDGFNRWDCGQRLAVDIIKVLADQQQGKEMTLDQRLVQAFRHLLQDTSLDQAMVAEMLVLPGISYIGEQMECIDIKAIYEARSFVKRTLAAQLHDQFVSVYNRLHCSEPYKPEAADIARRSLKNICLSYMVEHDESQGIIKAQEQIIQANNMTDTVAALHALIHGVHSSAASIAQTQMAAFAQKWKSDTNVMDMWFSLQARAETTGLEGIKQLMKHECFEFTNPNKLRSVIGVFCSANLINFHAQDHSGYEFLAEQVIALDKLNPQIASRLMMPLTRWKRYAPQYQQGMKKAIETIKAKQDLSPDVYEVVSRSIA